MQEFHECIKEQEETKVLLEEQKRESLKLGEQIISQPTLQYLRD